MSSTMMSCKIVEKFEHHLIDTFICQSRKKTTLDTSVHQSISWFRFTEDPDMTWEQSEDEILNAHPSIKFIHEIRKLI